MGQQQLILLALAVIIVGGAIVVGIRAFNENSIKSNADAMMQDAVRMANDAQAWKQKPAPFGGQAAQTGVCDAACVADPQNFSGASLARLGYQEVAGTYTNLNGVFTLAGDAGGLLVTGDNDTFGNQVQVRVCGLSDVNVNGAITELGSVDLSADAPPACGGGAGP